MAYCRAGSGESAEVGGVYPVYQPFKPETRGCGLGVQIMSATFAIRRKKADYYALKEGPRQSGATVQPKGACLAVTIPRIAAESVESGMQNKQPVNLIHFWRLCQIVWFSWWEVVK